jgi:hypothetical protein
MKSFIVAVSVLLSACATRHAPDTTAWFADCYNKQRQEQLLAQAESQLSNDDLNERRKIRQKFWDLQKECR